MTVGVLILKKCTDTDSRTQWACITCFAEAVSPLKSACLSDVNVLVILFQGPCFWGCFSKTSSDAVNYKSLFMVSAFLCLILPPQDQSVQPDLQSLENKIFAASFLAPPFTRQWAFLEAEWGCGQVNCPFHSTDLIWEHHCDLGCLSALSN